MHSLNAERKTGLSFDVPELIIAQAWADYHDLDFRVQLDGLSGDIACDELLSFRASNSQHWIISRTRNGVVAITNDTAPQHFDSLAEALESIEEERAIPSLAAFGGNEAHDYPR